MQVRDFSGARFSGCTLNSKNSKFPNSKHLVTDSRMPKYPKICDSLKTSKNFARSVAGNFILAGVCGIFRNVK